ncbi:MAG: GNAT family N-acetyltransferase [Asticcacaulis sp.]
MDISQLDNPAWFALTSCHAPMADGDGVVRRYPADVSPFAGLENPSDLPVLAARMTEGDTAVVWSPDIIVPPKGLELMVTIPCLQMVADPFLPASTQGGAQTMTALDVDEMIELCLLTRPGPFERRTLEMGRYIGLRAPDGRLVALAGQRMQLEDFTEISAICVHPDYVGRGYARRLMSILGEDITTCGRVPFLNVVDTNMSAIGLYESLGFKTRRMMYAHLLGKPGANMVANAYFSRS